MAAPFADSYPASTGDPEQEPPFRIQSVQAAAPVPEPDANGRLVPPAGTLVLGRSAARHACPSTTA